jgi:hypothetical protein
MRIVIKFSLVILVFVVGVALFGVLKETKSDLMFIWYIIIIPSMFAAWKAIWNYNPDKKNNDEDKHTLKKS